MIMNENSISQSLPQLTREAPTLQELEDAEAGKEDVADAEDNGADADADAAVADGTCT
jgi:hypothetical protein